MELSDKSYIWFGDAPAVTPGGPGAGSCIFVNPVPEEATLSASLDIMGGLSQTCAKSYIWTRWSAVMTLNRKLLKELQHLSAYL